MTLANQHVTHPPDIALAEKLAATLPASWAPAGAPTHAASDTASWRLRYAQCWEDADVLLEALNLGPGDLCVSIASAGDNTLALLAHAPARVIALDLNPAQLAALELRVAAYRALEHSQLLELVGSRPSQRRAQLYRRCRRALSSSARAFWDARPLAIAHGIGHAGKFERYFACFRRRVLPLLHSRRTVERLLAGGTRAQRQQFYRRNWDTRLWRAAFALFFSCPVMSRLGRDPSQFAYAEGSLAQHLRHRVRHALVAFDPAANPYVQWILTGEHRTALPFALRPENFDPIRTNLDRLEWRCQSLEAFLETYAGEPVARWNLSDIFEYLSPGHSRRLLQAIAGVSRRGARIVYWNLLARRERPPELAATWRPLRKLARRLHHADKAFFYSRVVVEERQ